MNRKCQLYIYFFFCNTGTGPSHEPIRQGVQESNEHQRSSQLIHFKVRAIRLEAIAASGTLAPLSNESSPTGGLQAEASAASDTIPPPSIALDVEKSQAVPVVLLNIVADITHEVKFQAAHTHILHEKKPIVATGVKLSSLLLSAGLLEGFEAPNDDDVLELSMSDVMLGLRDIHLTYTQNRVLVESHSHHSTDVIDVKAEHTSLWLTQSKLAIGLAAGQHLQHMMSSIQNAQGAGAVDLDTLHVLDSSRVGGGASSLAVGGSTGGNTSRVNMKLKLQLNCVAVAFALDQPIASGTAPSSNGSSEQEGAPLLELSFLKLRSNGEISDGWLSVGVSSVLQLDVYNGNKLAWEPVIEPWNFACEIVCPVGTNTAPHTSSVHGASIEQSQHTKLTLLSRNGLEVTITDSAIEAAVLATAGINTLSSIVKEPDTLSAVLRGFKQRGLPCTAFQLQNETGSDIEVWLEAPLIDGREPVRPPLGI